MTNAFAFDLLIDAQVELRDGTLTTLSDDNINSLATAICNVMLLNEDDVMAYINAKFIVAGKEPFFVNIKCKWHVMAGYIGDRWHHGSHYTKEDHAQVSTFLSDYKLACHAYERASTYTWRNLTFVGAY